MTAAGLVGIPIGLAILATVSNAALTLGIAALILVFAGLTLARWEMRQTVVSAVGVGVLSGACLTPAG